MKYTADCPACSREFDVLEPTTVELGLQCPSCGNRFTPEKIHRVSEPDRSVWKDSDIKSHNTSIQVARIHKIENIAVSLNVVSGIAVVVSFFLLLIAGYTDLSDGQPSPSPVWSARIFVMGAIAFTLAQLVYIRASLEHIRNK